MSLERLGYQAFFKEQLDRDPRPSHGRVGRVCFESRGFFKVLDGDGIESLCKLQGKLRKQRVAVGDFVCFQAEQGQEGSIDFLFERKTKLSRRKPGESKTDREQIAVANVDQVLVVTTGTKDLNFSKAERFCEFVRQGEAEPILILSKIDLIDDGAKKAESLRKRLTNIQVIETSTKRPESLSPLKDLCREGVTTAFVGESGVGKSSLINAMSGQALFETQEVRESDQKGRHTTTGRHLIITEENGIFVDTPGVRELGVWSQDTEQSTSFDDITALGENCKFKDCKHQSEPGCAVKIAVLEGTIAEGRLKSYQKLNQELTKKKHWEK